jgi:hypothetical protein
VLIALVLVASLSPVAATAAQRPLPASDYSASPVCGAPQPGRASCLAVGLIPRTAAARARSHPLGMTLSAGTPVAGPASGAYGLRPEDLHDAYELPPSAATAQTIGIVDAYDDPTIEADLRVYDEEFGLPACTTGNGCFRKVNEEGEASPLPRADEGWATEISLDVETSHAVCPNCQIVLVEAESSSFFDLEAAEETAVDEGATEISNSYGGEDFFEGSAYDHPGIVITASTGDWGYDNWSDPGAGDTANYPAASPDVVAVGGTHLFLAGESWAGETAWSYGGSGCSPITAAPAWQSAVPDWSTVGCGPMRAVADVAADADPYTGVAVYDSTPDPPYFPGWATVGGTSLSSPLIAAAFALAGGAHGVEYPAQTLYSNLGSSSLHDIVTGTNGACTTVGIFGNLECTEAEEEADCADLAICNAKVGYDGPTGVGTPAGLGAFGDGAGGPPPTVTAVWPARGATGGGTEVTIEGTGLADAPQVRFGAARATIVSDEEGKIVVDSPPHEPGEVNVIVTDSQGVRSSASAQDVYEYVFHPPTVTAITPAAGSTSGGTTVAIEGTNLREAEYVEFGGSYTPILSASEDQLTARAPAHEAGTVEVTVVGPDGATSAASPSDHYQYVSPAPPPSDTLSFLRSGSGQGQVLISPPGTFCAAACSQSFTEGTEVRLTAIPATGSSFQGWSGGPCSGTAPCEFSLTVDTTVTAGFEANGSNATPFFGIGTSSPSTSSTSSAAPETGATTPTAPRVDACLEAARRAFHRAAKAAPSAGKRHGAALRRARHLEAAQMNACRKRFGSSSR